MKIIIKDGEIFYSYKIFENSKDVFEEGIFKHLLMVKTFDDFEEYEIFCKKFGISTDKDPKLNELLIVEKGEVTSIKEKDKIKSILLKEFLKYFKKPSYIRIKVGNSSFFTNFKISKNPEYFDTLYFYIDKYKTKPNGEIYSDFCLFEKTDLSFTIYNGIIENVNTEFYVRPEEKKYKFERDIFEENILKMKLKYKDINQPLIVKENYIAEKSDEKSETIKKSLFEHYIHPDHEIIKDFVNYKKDQFIKYFEENLFSTPLRKFVKQVISIQNNLDFDVKISIPKNKKVYIYKEGEVNEDI